MAKKNNFYNLFCFISNIILLCVKIYNMNIGIEIKRLRRELLPEVTQMQFSKKIGITQSYLSLIETGKRTPDVGLLKKVARELGVPMAIMFWYLLDDNDIPDNKKEAFKVIKPIMDSLIKNTFN